MVIMGNKLRRFALALAILIMCIGCNSSGPSEIVIDPNGAISSTDIYSSSSSMSSSSFSSSSSTTSSSSSGAGGSSSSSSSTSAESISTDTSDTSEPESIPESSEYLTESSEESAGTSETYEPPEETSGEYSEPDSSSSTYSEPPSEPEPPAPPVEPDDSIQHIISQMTLKERVYQLFFVRPEQVSGSGYAETSEVDLSYKPVGGIICMGANLESVEQTRQMLAEMQESAMRNGIGVFIAVDEEGGRVARCAKNLGTTAFDDMAVYGARNNSNEAYDIGRTIGADIRSLGFNVDFAPVADVDISPTNELGSRIFSSDPYVVANMVSNIVRGLNSSGVAATLKHFPGLGAEDGNSHTASEIIIDRTLDQLRSEEFVPFRSGIQSGADFVMVGHQQVTAFGDELPADLSYTAVTKTLRGELGFNGIAITDAQEMNTISNLYYSRTAAVMAVNAGIDMILSPEDFDDAVDGVYNAVLSGAISEERLNESVTRILTIKQKMGLLP